MAMNTNIFTERAENVIRLLSALKMTLSVAESCTGGLLSKAITDISGASAVYKGGVCVYCNESKINLLGVSEDTVNSFGAVSEQTAAQMSQGVRRLFGSDVGIGITGIAGPASDGTDKPVGLIYISITVGGETDVTQLKNIFIRDIRNANRHEAAYRALLLLENKLKSLKG